MRRVAAAWAAVLVLATGAMASESNVRVWVLRDGTGKASDPANWFEGTVPARGDRVVIGRSGRRGDCVWDYSVELSSFTMTEAYKGTVSLESSRLRVDRNARIAGGMLDLDHGTLEVRNLLYLDKKGKLQLSAGKLLLGRKGFLVDDGGTLYSTGDEPADVTSATGGYYPFVIAQATVAIANAAGTTVERSRGIVVYSRARVKKADDVNVREVRQGSPGVTVYAKPGAEVSLVGWTFDDSVSEKIDQPLGGRGGTVTLTEAAAPASPAPQSAPPAPPPAAAEPPAVSTPAVAGSGQLPPIDIENTIMGRAMAREEGTQFTQYLNAQLLGGQYFFENQRGDLSGNANLLEAPSVKFNDSWTLLPSYIGNYQGTKEVLDLVGAGTLFSQRLDNRVGAQGVYTPDDGDSDWRLKPSASFKYELLKEVNDETFGTGLFDYWRIGAGLEAEYVYAKPFSVRVAYDYGFTHFPNYTSLESQQTLDFNGQPLARELVGSYVLDNNAHGLTVAANAPLGKSGMIAEADNVLLYQEYPDQHEVDGAGDLINPLRQDVTDILDLTLRRPQPVSDSFKLVESFDLGGTYCNSNQNSYDAANTRYLPGYYNFEEVRAGPSVIAYLGKPEPALKPVTIRLDGNLWYRNYFDRPPQNTDGSYLSGTTQQTNWMIGATVTYPMDANFSLLSNIQYGQALSNMAFQEFYTYNYNSFTYLFGVDYEF